MPYEILLYICINITVLVTILTLSWIYDTISGVSPFSQKVLIIGSIFWLLGTISLWIISYNVIFMERPDDAEYQQVEVVIIDGEPKVMIPINARNYIHTDKNIDAGTVTIRRQRGGFRGWIYFGETNWVYHDGKIEE